MGYLEILAFLISSHLLWGNLNPLTTLWKKKYPNCSRNRSPEMHGKHERNKKIFMTNLSLSHFQYMYLLRRFPISLNVFTQWPDVFHDGCFCCCTHFKSGVSAAHVVAPETTANKMCHLLIKWHSKRGFGHINLMYSQLFTKTSLQICHSNLDGKFITVGVHLQWSV